MKTKYFWYDGLIVMVQAYDKRQEKVLSWLADENERSLLYVIDFCRLYDLPCNLLIEFVN